MLFPFAAILAFSALVNASGPETAPAVAVPMELLEFDPPIASFRLNEMRDAPTSLKMRLRQPPIAPAVLYFESGNLKFSHCNVHFSPDDYNQWKTVDIRGLPYFTDADRSRNEIVAMRMSCPHGGKNWHDRKWSYPIERAAGAKGATCVSNGDPHITSFDGRSYDYMGLGCFYLVKSPALSVQTMTDKWGDSASVSVATAIRYGPAHFIIDAREGNAANRMVRLSGDAHGVDIVVSTNNQEFRFRFPDGSSVTITYHGGNPRAYLNHQIDVPACLKGRTQGLCGTYNGNRDDDWTASSGAVKPNVNEFGDSWRVPATDDIFICKHQCPDALAAMNPIKSCDQCKIPETLEGPGVFLDNQAGYRPWSGKRSTYAGKKPNYAGMPKFLIPRPPNNPDLDARAQAACNAAFADLHDARSILAPEPYIKSCIADCRLTGTLEMVDSQKTAYLNRVFTNVRPVLNLALMAPARRNGYANSPEVLGCRRAAEVLGLGIRRCPNNCSGHGTCLKRGCVCAPGWTGVACAKPLSAYGLPIGSGRAGNRGAYGPPQYADEAEYDDMESFPVISTFGGRPPLMTPAPRPVLRQPMTLRQPVFEGDQEDEFLEV